MYVYTFLLSVYIYIYSFVLAVVVHLVVHLVVVHHGFHVILDVVLLFFLLKLTPFASSTVWCAATVYFSSFRGADSNSIYSIPFLLFL